MADMKAIELYAAAYAEARGVLAERVATLQAEIDAVNRRHIGAIRQAVQAAAGDYDRLYSAIAAAPELFAKPKTQTMSGIRCGYMAGKARVDIPDEAETIRRIREQLPETQAALLIAVSERVDKRAVADLTGADLKRLRIRLEPAFDEVYIRPADAAVDKMVAALLRDAERLAEEAA